MGVIANNICWYPLPYYSRYHNYYGGGGYHHGGGSNGGPMPMVTPNPNAGPTTAEINELRRQRMHTPPLAGTVPPGGVVMTTDEEFGRGRGGIRRPTLAVAQTILKRDPDATEGTPILPPIERVAQKISKEIRVEGPPIIAAETGTIKTGAAERNEGKPLDEDLKRTRILGGRPPLVVENPSAPEQKVEIPTETKPIEVRRTGGVGRSETKSSDTGTVQPPPFNPMVPTEGKKVDIPAPIEQRRTEPPQTVTPRRVERSETPEPRVEQPKSEQPSRREEPKQESPPPRSEPRSEPKSEPRSEPKSEPKSEPRSEPKVDKPSAPVEVRKKDGR